MKPESIDEKIERLRPFFEQVAFFFLLLLCFITYDLLTAVPSIPKYTITVLFTGWSISLIIQELYVYKVFRPVLLGKRWGKLAKRRFMRE